MARTPLSAEETSALETEPEATAPETDAADEAVEPDTGEAPDDTEDKPSKDQAAKPAKQRTVPHGAMEAERQKRKAVEAEYTSFRREQEERQARLDERLSILSQALQPKPEQAEVPNPEDDIFGYVRHLESQLQDIRGQSEQERQASQQRTQHEEQQHQIVSAYRADAMEYANSQPEFSGAYQHLLRVRHAQLSEMGYTPAERQQIVMNDEMEIAKRAFQNRQSPADTIFRIARALGYQGKALAGVEGAPATNGAGKDATEQVARLAKTKEASATLSGAGAASGAGKITLESIDRMSKEEFSNFVNKMNRNNPHGFDKWFERESVRQ